MPRRSFKILVKEPTEKEAEEIRRKNAAMAKERAAARKMPPVPQKQK